MCTLTGNNAEYDAGLISSAPDLLFACNLAIMELENLYTLMSGSDNQFIQAVREGDITLSDSSSYPVLCE